MKHITAHCLFSVETSKIDIRTHIPKILEILLLDRTSSTPTKTKNIIWAHDNYKKYDTISYVAKAQLKPELITGQNRSLIIPRALKSVDLQKKRTKSKAEVFTPRWVVKKQNDVVDSEYQNDDLETYVRRKWLEISCGEAPYMTSRYEMESGKIIPLTERVGFVDRKLSRINAEITDKAEWQRLVELAYKSSYGFEWNGDSLFLARENLLYTYLDYYFEKWNEQPVYGLIENIAIIISYNIFQMDGLSYTIPLSEKMKQIENNQLSLFDLDQNKKIEWERIPGKRVKIMNWDLNKMEYFDKEIKNRG